MDVKTIEYRQLSEIMIMFAIVQFLGLLVVVYAASGTVYVQSAPPAIFQMPSSLLVYLAYIVFATLAIILISKYYGGRRFFIILEAFVIFIASVYLFLIAFNSIYPAVAISIDGFYISYASIVAVLCAAALVILKNKWQNLRNAAAIIASAGVGVVLGLSFSFKIAIIFMGIIAIYDFIAVFITKHMITLANAASNMNLALLVGINEVKAVPQKTVPKEYLKEYKKQIAAKTTSQISKSLGKNMVPFIAKVELGTGDLAIPLMVAISAYNYTLNFVLSFFIIFGAILGLGITMFILKRYARPLPAIPPLFLGVLIGILFFLLLHRFV
ncbi:MAG: presenilin family intramembrane aspartyl protease [Candidatus Micrarchaeaceae archaeon]